MAIQLELDPVVEEKVAAKAAARGLRPEEYASRVVTEDVEGSSQPQPGQQDAILKMLDRWASYPSIRISPGETFSREMIYADQPKVP
jgi:hypothetical protein